MGVGGGTIGPDCFYLVCSVGDQTFWRELKTLLSLDSWGCVGGAWAPLGTELITTLKKKKAPILLPKAEWKVFLAVRADSSTPHLLKPLISRHLPPRSPENNKAMRGCLQGCLGWISINGGWIGEQWSATSARSLKTPNSELVCQIKTTTTEKQLSLNLLSFSISDSFICAELINNMFLLSGTVSKH